MSEVKPRTMSGALELLPRDQIAFQRLLDAIRRSYERFGFLPIETPVMEYVDVLLSKSGGDTAKQIYFAQSRGARDQGREPELALRFDLTVPLARYVAEHEGELTFPFRRYQIQRVYRGENVQRGRYREFYQCDLDVVGKGSLSLEFDAEVPTVIYHTFREIYAGKFTVQLNNRKVLWGILESLGVEGEEAQAAVLREIDKLDRRGPEAVAATLAEERFGLGESRTGQLLQILCRDGTNRERLAAAEELGGGGRLQEGLEELHTVLRALADLEVPEDHVRVNLGIARGLDYYTGTVYETLLEDHPALGSVCSGGRYENLASQYTRSQLPGVGASIGATRLFYQLRELGLVEKQSSTVAVLVTQIDASLTPACRGVAAQLRAAGINTELYHEATKMGKQLRHADRAGIPLAVILGPEEHARGAVVVKNLGTGTQEEVPAAQLAGAVSRALAGVQ